MNQDYQDDDEDYEEFYDVKEGDIIKGCLKIISDLKIIKTFNDKTLDQNIICACAEYKIKLKVRLSNSFDFYCVGVSERLEIVHGPRDMIYFLKAMTNNFQT